MTNYRAILLYYSKGNTTTQVATICGCSRTTVIRTIKRVNRLTYLSLYQILLRIKSYILRFTREEVRKKSIICQIFIF